eukprot:2467819-Prorocentrum_lima.AAC.1
MLLYALQPCPEQPDKRNGNAQTGQHVRSPRRKVVCTPPACGAKSCGWQESVYSHAANGAKGSYRLK